MGPHSRTLLSRVTGAPINNMAFPFGSIRELSIGPATVLASRRSYVGELGWELYVPTEFAVLVYDTLVDAGADLGLSSAGYYAIDSLRIEKGYRAWGRELTPDVTPWQAGLGFAVALQKGWDFLGRSALVVTERQPLTKRLVSILAEDPDTPIAWGGELIRADGAAVGDVTSAAYGHTLGRIVGLGWLKDGDGSIDAEWIARRRFTVDIAGVEVPIRCQLRPFYDPASARMRV